MRNRCYALVPRNEERVSISPLVDPEDYDQLVFTLERFNDPQWGPSSMEHAFRPVVIGKHRGQKHHPRIFAVGNEAAPRVINSRSYRTPFAASKKMQLKENVRRTPPLRV
jgi:hypothetical protein